MSSNPKYNLAVALLQFKSAYHNLVEASKCLPNYDVSDNYPFYLLEYEDIENAVLQWCTVHAERLLREVPDRESLSKEQEPSKPATPAPEPSKPATPAPIIQYSSVRAKVHSKRRTAK